MARGAPVKAVIMAGGEGTRLRPLTANQPKPMLPVGNRPIMEHIVRHIRDHGFKDIVVTVQFLASQVRNYFGDGSDMGVDLAYATEPTPLGTAGSVRNAAEMLGETFVVISGDALTDIDLDEVVSFHRRRGALATVVLKRMPNPLEFGIVITRDDGRIERFLEKPHWGQVFSDTINSGIYVLEPEVFEHIPEGQPADFAGDVFPKLLGQGAPLFGFVADGYWEDVGSLEAYQRAHQDILDGKVKVDVRGFQVRPGIWLGEGAELDPDAALTAPVLIGDFTKVEAGARLREYTVVGSGVIVKRDAFLHRAIVHDNAYIGPGTSLRGCVVGRSADVKQGGRVEDGVVVGDNADIGHGAILQPNVKVYPYKTVEPGAIVTKSIIWEGRGARGLFGEDGVTGIGNVDLTPEMVLRVATAFGSTLKKGSRVTLGRDASRVSRALKRAIIAGLNSTGVTCEDLELAPAPSVRFSAARMGASGGMYVRTSPKDSQSVELAVFGGDGSDVDESTRRRIERTYYREEFRRAFGQEMGELRYPPRVVEHYAVALVHSLDDAVVRHRRFKVVIDAGGGTASLVLPHLLSRLSLDSLIVNGHLDETRVAPTEDERQADLDRLAKLVTASGADLGVLFDAVGERIVLVDERGAILGLDRALLLYVDLIVRTEGGGDIALPVSTTRLAAGLAIRHGRQVHGCKLSTSAIMRAAQREGVVFAGAEGGGYVFPVLHPAYDGLLSFGKLLELLAVHDTTLGAAVDALPEPSVVRRRVPTPWERKGAVMRQLVEATKGRRVDDTDGIKVFHPPARAGGSGGPPGWSPGGSGGSGGRSAAGPWGDDWVLVIPDTVEPVTHLWAEAGHEAAAAALADGYEALIRRAADLD
ncbi:MAG TPA: sugar phosphate nucleotidyltransferase [Actinomycetes bacterium]|nr:sugar phosphate nucleotidyltransferase [Actinomycetes bacterium]